MIDEARKGHGAIAALPVSDTLKRVDSSGKISHALSTVAGYGERKPRRHFRARLSSALTVRRARPTALRPTMLRCASRSVCRSWSCVEASARSKSPKKMISR